MEALEAATLADEVDGSMSVEALLDGLGGAVTPPPAVLDGITNSKPVLPLLRVE